MSAWLFFTLLIARESPNQVSKTLKTYISQKSLVQSFLHLSAKPYSFKRILIVFRIQCKRFKTLKARTYLQKHKNFQEFLRSYDRFLVQEFIIEPIMEEKQNESQPILHYFSIRGSCQPLRNLLYYLEVDFKDVIEQRSPQNDAEVGFNLGLPWVQDGEIRIHQPVAIMYYMARKLERMDLIGLTPQSNARIQQVLMKYEVQRKKIMSSIFQMITQLPKKQDKDAFIDIGLKKMVVENKFIEFCLKNLARGKRFCVDTLTLVDFIFYEQTFYVCGFLGQYIKMNTIFKFFVEFKENFEKLPFFEKNKQKIEGKALFHEFGNPEINQSIRKLWKGAKCGNLLVKSNLSSK